MTPLYAAQVYTFVMESLTCTNVYYTSMTASGSVFKCGGFAWRHGGREKAAPFKQGGACLSLLLKD